MKSKGITRSLPVILAKVGFVVSVILIITYVIIILMNKNKDVAFWPWFQESVLWQFRHNIGDFIWGTLGVTLTFTATAFLFVTFNEQREQLKITRRDAEKVRFESTYFNILSMLKQVQDTVNANIHAHLKDRGITDLVQYYANFKDFYKEQVDANSNFAKMISAYQPITANKSETEQYMGAVAEVYEKMIEDTGCNIGYLYRYLFNAIKFVLDFAVVGNEDDEKKIFESREKYLNLLQAQLSNEELCLIFYNSLSKYGQNKDGRLYFKEILDNTHFLENIDKSFLLNTNQYTFYPHTPFKFLNREQMKKVIK